MHARLEDFSGGIQIPTYVEKCTITLAYYQSGINMRFKCPAGQYLVSVGRIDSLTWM